MPDPTALLLAAAGGDDRAFESFVRATQADVWRLCRHLVSQDEADDATQEVYLRVARSMHRFRGRGSARAWITTIARRVCADRVGHLERERARVAGVADLQAALPATPPDTTVEVRDALALVPHDQREALVLTQVLGLPYAEAADVVGVPVGTIRSRVARGRAALVDALASRPPASDRRRGTTEAG